MSPYCSVEQVIECGWHISRASHTPMTCGRVRTHPNVSLVLAQAAQILGPAGQGAL